ncbi:MAG: TetR/AcrR family transcriptional regulator [Myxococcales bacterium]|nr:TetR/AcrR family transcriptional regulator [Myxococcales bacterium]
MSTREDLVEAATRIYVDEGPSALSMRGVAKAVGVSAPAIYRHFESKEDLVIAIGLRASRMFESYLVRALRARSPEARLWEMGLAYRDFAMDHPSYYRALFMFPHPGFENLREETAAEFGTTFRLLVDRVVENQGCKRLRAGEPEQVALTIWAHVHGLVSLFLDRHLLTLDERAFRAFYESSLEVLLRGLRD